MIGPEVGVVTRIRPVRAKETHPGFLIILLRKRHGPSIGTAEMMECELPKAVIFFFFFHLNSLKKIFFLLVYSCFGMLC